eukprot:Gb_16721 [translate_table: standard]
MRGTERVPVRSNLEKPLEELTHEDIMQLTREDCRRYLKEKGMRRPSWNKSQAIQQVLSLKRLFDSSRPDDQKKSAETTRSTPNENVKEPAGHLLVHRPEQESHPVSPISKDLAYVKLGWLTESKLPGLASRRPQTTVQHSILNTPSVKQSGAQLTIFYSGIVNVYDDVPADTAQAIMLLAGSKNYLPAPLLTRYSAQNTNQSTVHTPYNSMTRANISSISVAPPVSATVAVSSCINSQTHKEIPLSREASLQRFLEKRKDRSRWKAPSLSLTKKPPMLMGMLANPSFLHPQYTTDSIKTKSTKSGGSETTTSSNRAPRTPRRTSSTDQGICSGRKLMRTNHNDYDFAVPDDKFFHQDDGSLELLRQ